MALVGRDFVFVPGSGPLRVNGVEVGWVQLHDLLHLHAALVTERGARQSLVLSLLGRRQVEFKQRLVLVLLELVQQALARWGLPPVDYTVEGTTVELQPRGAPAGPVQASTEYRALLYVTAAPPASLERRQPPAYAAALAGFRSSEGQAWRPGVPETFLPLAAQLLRPRPWLVPPVELAPAGSVLLLSPGVAHAGGASNGVPRAVIAATVRRTCTLPRAPVLYTPWGAAYHMGALEALCRALVQYKDQQPWLFLPEGARAAARLVAEGSATPEAREGLRAAMSAH